jgi:hypothetical protein
MKLWTHRKVFLMNLASKLHLYSRDWSHSDTPIQTASYSLLLHPHCHWFSFWIIIFFFCHFEWFFSWSQMDSYACFTSSMIKNYCLLVLVQAESPGNRIYVEIVRVVVLTLSIVLKFRYCNQPPKSWRPQSFLRALRQFTYPFCHWPHFFDKIITKTATTTTTMVTENN